MLEKLIKIWPQYAIPQHLLSAMMYRFMRIPTPWIKNLQIRSIVRAYNVNMAEAGNPDPKDFATFNAFFTRSLLADARPIGRSRITCPADGAISELGRVESGRLLQAKGRAYHLEELLAGDMESAAEFKNGSFMTVYLAPRDYHRVHMPIAGTLQSMTYVPGKLFSVNQVTAREVPKLFARNERVICRFETELGPAILILVGAIFVGSMETVWAGQITPPYSGQMTRTEYPPQGEKSVQLDKGAEMGRFNMGSTVILLFPRNAPAWQADLSANKPVRMGQSLSVE